MTKAAEDILDDALALPLDQRAELAAELLASLDGEPEEAVEEAWRAEIIRRIARIQQGEAKGRPWEEIRAELEQRRR